MMTLKQLSKYHDVKIELDDLSNRIKELEMTLIKATRIDENKVDTTFVNGSPTERVAIKINELKTKYCNKQIDLMDELSKIEEYLDTINDNEVRTIIRKRFIDLMTWEKIAEELHYSNPVVYYKVKNYLSK